MCLYCFLCRQIALKALSERLSKVEPQPSTATVSWEQDRTKIPVVPSTSQTVAIAISSEEMPAKPNVTSPPPPTDKKITIEPELSKT